MIRVRMTENGRDRNALERQTVYRLSRPNKQLERRFVQRAKAEQAKTAPSTRGGGGSASVRRVPILRVAFGAALALALAGCESKKESPASPEGSAKPESSTAPSPAAPAPAPAAPLATSAGLDPEVVQAAVNAKKRPAYSGPTGKIVGKVTASGEEPPVLTAALEQIPDDCLAARETFKHLYREGPGRTVGDALVTVTGYDAYVPAKDEAVVVEGRGCAWNTRTVGLTFGQRLEVVSKDERTYVPELLGQRMPAQLFAVPGGKPIDMSPKEPGRFILVDSMRLFNAAEVLVLRYSTFDVTGVDGRFEIEGVPVGKVQVSALVPVTREQVSQEVVVKAGETTTVDLTVPFDQAKYEQGLKVPAPGSMPAVPE